MKRTDREIRSECFGVLFVFPLSRRPRRVALTRRGALLVLCSALLLLCLLVAAPMQFLENQDLTSRQRSLRGERDRLAGQVGVLQDRLVATSEVLARVSSFERRVRELTMLSDPGRGLGPVGSATSAAAASGFETGAGTYLSGEGLDPLPPRGPLFIPAAPAGRPEWGTLDRLQEKVEVERGRLEELLGYLVRQRALLACTPSISPADGWLTSRFGPRRNPFTAKVTPHEGLDIAAAAGTPVIAPAAGVVRLRAYEENYGKLLVIDHGFGLQTRYGHLKRFDVTPGERVERGQLLGELGNTGRSTGSHLHYEVLLYNTHRDPERYILDR